MKTTNQPQECECPGSARQGQITKARGGYFMTACTAFARRCAAVLRWLAIYASPGVVAYGYADQFMEPVPFVRMHKVSGAEIAGAVAASLLRDIREHGLRINGFPQISVHRAGVDAKEYEISLNFDSARVALKVPAMDAIRAGQRFKNGRPQAGAFFDLVQEALWKLGAMPCK